MVDYREIIRLKSAGYSNTSVASSSGSGRNKVAEVWKRAKEKNISWPIPSTLTNEDLKLILYPELQDSSLRMLPDYKRIHAYEFFGGVPRITIPDNCKTSTSRNTRTEVVLNRSYHEMAEYYGTAVIPARPLLMCARFIRLILYTYRNICQRAIVNTCSLMQSIIWTGQKRSVLRRGS